MEQRVEQRSLHQVLVSDEVGGGAKIALNISRHMQLAGWTSRVWIPGPGKAWNEATTMGLATAPFDAAGAMATPKWGAILANWRLGRGLRRNGNGLVHVHSPAHFGALRWGLRMSGLSRIVHVHIDENPALLRWAFRNPPELIVTCAESLVANVASALPESKVAESRIVALPNAVDTQRFAPGPKPAAKCLVNAPSDRPLLLMLANLSPHKGQETAIRAVAHLKDRGVNVECWLAGEERNGKQCYTERLKQFIRESGVEDRIRLLGHRNDAPELLRAADLFLLPSTNEGLPLTILEAQASKVPVLAAPTAGVPEVVLDGETGYLIAADDANAYAQQILKLLECPDLYHRIADAAYSRAVQRYNWTAYCRRLQDLYEEVMDHRLNGARVTKRCATHE
jgi:glycosyltransferase involved in cell wall biosynthesis